MDLKRHLVEIEPVQKTKLPTTEAGICRRLRYARESILEMTQAGCAKQIGLDRGTLANYETERTPLRFEVALRFCRQFIICEEWLATGQFESCHKSAEAHGISGKNGWDFFDQKILIRQCVDLLSDPATIHIKPGMLLSEAFSTVLHHRFSQLVDRYFYAQRIVLSSSDNPELPENLLKAIHQRHYVLLSNEAACLKIEPSDLRRLYTRYVFQCANLVCRKLLGASLNDQSMQELDWLRSVVTDPNAKIGPPHVVIGDRQEDYPRDASLEFSKIVLPVVTASGNYEGVKAKLQSLLERLNKATAERGMKSELAKFMGVPLPNVSQWLSGEREPGGETTLRLLHWVEQQERQK